MVEITVGPQTISDYLACSKSHIARTFRPSKQINDKKKSEILKSDWLILSCGWSN